MFRSFLQHKTCRPCSHKSTNHNLTLKNICFASFILKLDSHVTKRIPFGSEALLSLPKQPRCGRLCGGKRIWKRFDQTSFPESDKQISLIVIVRNQNFGTPQLASFTFGPTWRCQQPSWTFALWRQIGWPKGHQKPPKTKQQLCILDCSMWWFISHAFKCRTFSALIVILVVHCSGAVGSDFR